MGKNGQVKRKDEPTCFTYDAKENVMLGGALRRRFDRILVQTRQRPGGVVATTTTTTTTTTMVKDVELIGREKIGDTTWTKESNWNGRVTRKVVPLAPSDHFGYVVNLVVGGREN